MIDAKGLIYCIIFAGLYIVYLVRTKRKAAESEPESITAEKKILIDELHKLTEQHANLKQFLFDTEQEKETTYNISYKAADNSTKTAEIIKAIDSTPYIQELTRQQLRAIEKRVQYLVKELNKPIPRLDAESQKALYKVTQTENEREQRSRKGESGGLLSLFVKAVGGVLKRKEMNEND